MQKTVFVIVLFFLSTCNSFADEIRMAYLEIRENHKDSYTVLLKTPIKNNAKLAISSEFSSGCEKSTQVKTQLVSNAYLSSWDMRCEDSIVGKTIGVHGLKGANTDLLLQIKLLDGASHTVLLSPNNESYIVPLQESSVEIIGTYTLLGIEHILIGFDHLLFVFALLLIVKSLRQLIWTITAFTIAHSITLGGAALGFLKLPQQPVEAIIALSILFLAMEVVHQKRGINGIASRFPWIVSFTFGLLHGFGFAGALEEIGLPQHSVVSALLFFNVGVEIGQLIFVSGVLLIGLALRKLNRESLIDRASILTVYAIGGLSSFWFIERVSAF